MEPENILQNVGVVLVVVISGLLIASLINFILRRRQRSKPIFVGSYPLKVEGWRGPLRALIPAVLLRLAAVLALTLPETLTSPLVHALDIWIIAALAWFAKRTVDMVQQAIVSRYPMDVEDNLEARSIRTQTRILARILNATIIVVAAALILMSFPAVRDFGVSLLVSAGFAAVVVGLAAQNSLSAVFAGIQIALTQPIRLDDVVIVDGEWGRVEEITLTFVVVRIWDQRRLVIPINHFTDNTFQNWTRPNAEILGTVYLYADYSVPVEEVRQELKRILDDTPLWDGRAWGLVVTDSTEKTVELRALMSAEDSSQAWDLRCLVREELIGYLQRQFPQSLPTLRLEGEIVAPQ